MASDFPVPVLSGTHSITVLNPIAQATPPSSMKLLYSWVIANRGYIFKCR